jgi:hypothetical protein
MINSFVHYLRHDFLPRVSDFSYLEIDGLVEIAEVRFSAG